MLIDVNKGVRNFPSGASVQYGHYGRLDLSRERRIFLLIMCFRKLEFLFSTFVVNFYINQFLYRALINSK